MVEREGRAPPRIADGCALHAGEPFTAICRECGTYMCRQCSEDGRFDRCAGCRAESVREAASSAVGDFPFRRDGIEWGRFLRYCFEVYTKNFGLLTLTMIACFGAFMALQLLGGLLTLSMEEVTTSLVLWAALTLPYVAALGGLIVGVLQIAIHVARGEPASLSMLWAGAPRVGAFLLVSAATVLAMFGLQVLLAGAFTLGFASLDASDWTLGTLLVAVLLGLVALLASVYVSLGLVFAGAEVVAQPGTSAWSALKNGWRLADGERMTVGFGLFLIWLLVCAGVLLCGVGLIFTLGFASVLFASLYLALRNGAPLGQR